MKVSGGGNGCINGSGGGGGGCGADSGCDNGSGGDGGGCGDDSGFLLPAELTERKKKVCKSFTASECLPVIHPIIEIRFNVILPSHHFLLPCTSCSYCGGFHFSSGIFYSQPPEGLRREQQHPA